jgi:hypothetical protein
MPCARAHVNQGVAILSGCSQSRRAGSRGTDINCGGPGRTHSRCICSTHCASKRCGQHAAPHSRPGTVAGVGLAATHGLRRQPPRARRRPGPAFDPMFRHARGGGAMCATGCVAGHSQRQSTVHGGHVFAATVATPGRRALGPCRRTRRRRALVGRSHDGCKRNVLYSRNKITYMGPYWTICTRP